MKQLNKQYDSFENEQKVYENWEQANAFKPDSDSQKDPYTIMLPPPNITGSLHMGHALQDTIMDILARYHRLQGYTVLWQPGTDSAAIATNKIISDQLAEEGLSRHDLGREKFLKRAHEWYAKTGAEILNQMKRLGCSCDWSRNRFTLDQDYIDSVNQAFIEFYQRGYIYRGSRIVNWDPKTQTTVSDLEIDYQNQSTNFYYFQYGPFEIGTARPETKFADKYIVVHPDDERYSDYQSGQQFEVDWIFDQPITATLIKDEAADPDMGSGAMTITPWHSQVDFELAQKHDLEMEPIIDLDGKLLPIAGEFAGLSIQDARPKIVEKLKSKGLLINIDNSYQHKIALNDRGKGVLEPQVMRQWFIDMSKLKDRTIQAATDQDIKFVPPRWKQHFINWMENVYDWNINRQIWLGHRLPVWWKRGTHNTDQEDDNFVVSLESPGEDYVQDPDVLDTWFSSALWPFATLGWPETTDDLNKFYPTSVLVTARDILYLWVARMIFSGLDLVGKIPFKDVFIHPTVLTKDGQRMSKSLGTGLDPLDLIDTYGADALRFGLMHQMSYDNQAIRFDERDVETGRNFANKLWNIARFLETLPTDRQECLADRWIQHRLAHTSQSVQELISHYKFGEAVRELYHFVWNDYADWYVEILKTDGSSQVAHQTFFELLKILHPFLPHITETLWQHFQQTGLLMQSAWPILPSHPDTPADMQHFQNVVQTVRSARRLLNIPANANIKIYLENPLLEHALENLTKSNLVSEIPSDAISLPLKNQQKISLASEHINQDSLAAARDRLAHQITQLDQETTQIQNQLDNMRGKAPAQVISEKEQALSHLEQTKTALEQDLKALN